MSRGGVKSRGGRHYNVDALCVFAPARVRVVNSARRASIPARTSGNEVSQVQHRHVAPETAYQRSLAILAATRTQTAGEPHHAVAILGERRHAREVGARWRARDHFTIIEPTAEPRQKRAERLPVWTCSPISLALDTS
jgi:hypothetical protein